MYPYEIAHSEALRALAPQCCVLLKSDGSFPLAGPGRIALYGSGARKTVKGGTGSGDVNVRHAVSVEEGLEKAGFTVTTKGWLDGYDQVYDQARADFVASVKAEAQTAGIPAVYLGMGRVMSEPEYTLPLDDEEDTALYVLARNSGEGNDRVDQPGDFRLTATEIRDILALARTHSKFLLLLNVGGPVDLSPVVEEVPNLLVLSQLGMTVGDVAADLILGRAYPSGKLATTWAKAENYPNVGTFGHLDDTVYTEGIYVGYRWFDTLGKAPLFPFGFGLGWTTFQLSPQSVKVEGRSPSVTVRVKNTGKALGREVVQLYLSLPWGKLDQPYQALAAFAKTEELAPGQEILLTLSFDLADLASFDPETKTRILEPGDYLLRVGSSSRDTRPCAALRLEETVVVERLHDAGGSAAFTDWRPEAPSARPVAGVPVFPLSPADFPERPWAGSETPEAPNLTPEEMTYLCIGDYRTAGDPVSVIGMAGTTVAGAAAETTSRLKSKGIQPLVLADGPAGLRLSRQYGVDEQGVYPVGDVIPSFFLDFLEPEDWPQAGPERHGEIHDQYCSAIPIGTAIAQSWDLELARACGDLVGAEMERFGVHLWLAPALNLHRSPLCGRNFEYYSEDPLISGKMAAAITRGVQAHPRRGVTIKHFCCNNQELNRFHNNSHVNQRALRDLYLKGFELCVREAAPLAVMTSYNLLNGVHTANRRDLLTDVLRTEWGFSGIVMTDWGTTGEDMSIHNAYGPSSSHGCIAAGNDVIMPGYDKDRQDIQAALASGALKLTDLQACAGRMLAMIQALQP